MRRHDSEDAIVFWSEDKHKLHRRLCWRQLNELVSRLQQAFQALGLTAGDRVAAYMANTPETVAAIRWPQPAWVQSAFLLTGFRRPGFTGSFRAVGTQITDRPRRPLLCRKVQKIRNINILTDKIKSIDKVIIVPLRLSLRQRQ
ncbi:MAG: AMP-binding protein [Pseudomonadales bacterium]